MLWFLFLDNRVDCVCVVSAQWNLIELNSKRNTLGSIYWIIRFFPCVPKKKRSEEKWLLLCVHPFTFLFVSWRHTRNNLYTHTLKIYHSHRVGDVLFFSSPWRRRKCRLVQESREPSDQWHFNGNRRRSLIRWLCFFLFFKVSAVCFRQQQTREMVKKNFAAASQHRLRFLWINLIALLAHIGFSSADYVVLLDTTKEDSLDWTRYPFGPQSATPGVSLIFWKMH